MKKRTIFLLILVSLSINWFSMASAESRRVLVACPEWSGYTNVDGTGAYWEIIKSVFEPCGVSVVTKIVPWKRALFLVENKKADAVIGIYHEPASNLFYPQWHISVEDPIVVVYKKAPGTDWQAKGIQSLEERTAAWIRGYDFDRNLLKELRVNKFEFNTIEQGLKLLRIGRIDFLLDYEADIRRAASATITDFQKDYCIQTIKPGQKLFAAFAGTEKSKGLILIFDRQMTHLAQSGEIEKIYLKWGFSAEKFGKDRFSYHPSNPSIQN